MNIPFHVRTTRTKRCAEGFYLIINGHRLRFKNKASAVAACLDWLGIQRVQIVSVREFANRNARRIARIMPRAGRNAP